jgi:hypothetical protein
VKAGFLLIALGASLAACIPAGSQPPVRAAPPPVRVAQRVAPPVSRPPPREDDEREYGSDHVLGRNARALVAQFGTPGLDVREGSARKLQFLGPTCVLDVYLYPPEGGGEPVATYVDARLPDGRDTERAPCIAALSRR